MELTTTQQGNVQKDVVKRVKSALNEWEDTRLTRTQVDLLLQRMDRLEEKYDSWLRELQRNTNH